MRSVPGRRCAPEMPGGRRRSPALSLVERASLTPGGHVTWRKKCALFSHAIAMAELTTWTKALWEETARDRHCPARLCGRDAGAEHYRRHWWLRDTRGGTDRTAWRHVH